VSEHEHLHPRQDPDAPSWRWLTGVTAGAITLSIGLALIAAWVVSHYQGAFGGPGYPRDDQASLRARAGGRTVRTRLFTEYGPGEGQQAREAARARLESWAWVDREAQVVRIPIDAAIELVATAKNEP
jgi:hypothetical protein